MGEFEPIKSTLICFSKLCNEKRIYPYFKGDNGNAINNFFYNMKEEYSNQFKRFNFATNSGPPLSEEVSEEIMNLRGRDILAINYNVSLFKTMIGLSENYNKLENKEIFEKIAQKFYDEVGCNEKGEIGKHNSLDGLV